MGVLSSPPISYLYATWELKTIITIPPLSDFIYTPLQWLKVFADYNWDRYDWKMDAQDRNNAATQTPADNCFPAVPINQNHCWNSSGIDRTNTVSFGSDVDLIPNIFGFRLQYTFSNGHSYGLCQRRPAKHDPSR